MRARIELSTVDALNPEITGEELGAAPTLTLANVRAHVTSSGVALRGSSGIYGHVDLTQRRAQILARPNASALELQGALTLSAALLLGRIGRALIHAATIVDLDGRGWLLVGDSHAGKTTTCATLIASGWRYVADDQVVLSCNNDCVVAEGWPREAHLDAGWHDKNVEHRRVPADLSTLREGAWIPTATVHGVLFPRVVAEEPTRLESVAPADALTRIVRQSPWLFADASTAGETLSLLTRVASLECAALILGRDSYANGAVLLERLSAARTR